MKSQLSISGSIPTIISSYLDLISPIIVVMVPGKGVFQQIEIKFTSADFKS